MDEFSNAFQSMLTEIGGIIYELNMDKMCTSMSKEAVDITKHILEDYDMQYVMDALANNHNGWQGVKNKDYNFIMNVFIPILKRLCVPIDTDLIAAPFLYHEKMKVSEKWRLVKEDDKPLNQSDIDVLWECMRKMLVSVLRWTIGNKTISKYSGMDAERCTELLLPPSF